MKTVETLGKQLNFVETVRLKDWDEKKIYEWRKQGDKQKKVKVYFIGVQNFVWLPGI